MDQMCASLNVVSTMSDGEIHDSLWSNELDHVPLMVRRKMLFEIKPNVDKNLPESSECGNQSQETYRPQIDVKMEEDCCHQQGEIHNCVWSHELDHVPLIMRRQTLCAIKELSDGNDHNSASIEENKETSLSYTDIIVSKEDNNYNSQGDSEEFSKNLVQQFASEEKEEIQSLNGAPIVAQTQFDAIPERNTSGLCKTSVIGSSNGVITRPGHRTWTKLTKSITDFEILESDRSCLCETAPKKLKFSDGQDYVNANMNTIHGSTLLTSVKVKAEPSDSNNLDNGDNNAVGSFCFNTLPVKSEPEVHELYGDELDHVLLQDRINLLPSGQNSHLNAYTDDKSLSKIFPSTSNCSPISESAKPIRIIPPRKRKKTATDSIEIAMEEDAPGLLKVLIDKGILVEEIKLYGEKESDDPLDDSFCEDSFSELEAVISKLFSQRHSLLKFPPLRCAKGSKATYCLTCLLSLVEQTRHLQFRKWPVEWGWCRDLQSFIFVFERHNRIVLERPEYGYATYFFELVNSMPIDWQVKRLVTAMKLTSCSRTTLIENKVISVGEDLTEGEARVLMEYGWIPNSSLGAMLSYCDRVIHDRKNEKETSEWRSKIGKLLMDGYNGGIIVSSSIPNIIPEVKDPESPQIKSEI